MMAMSRKSGKALIAEGLKVARCIPLIHNYDTDEIIKEVLGSISDELAAIEGGAARFAKALQTFHLEDPAEDFYFLAIEEGYPALKGPIAAIGIIPDGFPWREDCQTNVRVLVVLAAPDAASTRRMIRAFARVLTPKTTHALVCAGTRDDVRDILLEALG